MNGPRELAGPVGSGWDAGAPEAAGSHSRRRLSRALGIARQTSSDAVLAYLTLGVAALAALLVFQPLLGAYFFADDYGFLAIGEYLRSPLEALLGSHFPAGKYFRPVGLALWWLADKIARPAPSQYALSIALHCAVTGLVYLLVRRCGGDKRGGVVAAIAFLVHPLSVATVAWLSNRFDVLATLFLLGALALASRPSAGARWGALLLSVLAFLAKETGFAATGALVAGALLDPGLAYRQRVAWGVVYGLAGAAGLVWRAYVLPQWSANAVACLPCSVADGLSPFARHGLAYLSGVWPLSGPAWPVITVVGIAVMLLVVNRGKAQPGRARSLWIVAVIALGLSSAIAAVAVSEGNPPAPGATGFVSAVINSRHYYLPFALLLVVGGGVARRSLAGLRGKILVAATGLMLAVWIASAAAIAERWVGITNNGDEVLLGAIVRKLERSTPPSNSGPCMVSLTVEDGGAGRLKRFVDVAAKAFVPGPSRWDACMLFVAGSRPYYLLLPGRAAPPGLLATLTQQHPPMRTRSFSLVYPAPWEAGRARPARRLTVSAGQ